MKILYLRKFDKYCKYWLLPQIRTQLYMGPADPKTPQTFPHLFSAGSKAIRVSNQPKKACSVVCSNGIFKFNTFTTLRNMQPVLSRKNLF